VKSVAKLTLHVPEDEGLLAALGEVALRHEHMNYVLRMTIKSLAGVTPTEAIAATEYETSRQWRKRARTLARKRLGEGAPLIKLQAILASCGSLTEQRNQLVHGLWAKQLDGEAQIRNPDVKPRSLPTAQELRALATEIKKLTDQLNQERLEGFLYEALSKSTKLGAAKE